MTDPGGKRALVCGSTRGIGRAAAEALAKSGMRVTLCARNKTLLEEVRSGLPGAGHDFIVADFDDPGAVAAAARQHIADTGPYLVLINNSGGPKGGPILDAVPAEFEAAFARHLICNHLLAQALIPGMRAAGFGRIVNIISTSVKQPIPGLGVSNTIRGAVASWAKTLATEVASWGITVNNVLPGFTDTDRLRSIIAAKAAATGRAEEDVAAEMEASIPAARFATPQETAQAVLFLVSPEASYITGTSIPVDGGRISAL